jgi:four helix bundle protein
MKRVHELDVYKPAEELSDMIWYDFDKWSKKVQNTMGYQIIRSSDSIAVNIAEGYGTKQ